MSNLISKFGHAIVKKIFFLKISDVSNSSSLLIDELTSKDPSMIARFGSTEIKAVIYPQTKWPFNQILKKMMKYNPSLKVLLK